MSLMQCPNDGTTLAITERKNVEIDYCPQCRGVWLDRGELDKIIDQAAMAQPTPQAQPAPPQQQQYQQPRYDSSDKHHGDDHYKKKRKESFLGDMFDF
jgi:Zn-finger nucleic acid-binding protein